MNKAVLNILSENADNIYFVNKIIVSAFLNINGLERVNNRIIQQHIITDDAEEILVLNQFLSNVPESGLNFEDLIELFEFVLSPADKVVNGAVYTPESIRKYIVNASVSKYPGNLDTIKTADIACGCGGFLLTLSEKLHTITNRTFSQIYSDNIYGIDIAEHSVTRTKILLSLYAILNGEDEFEFEFNLFTDNSLIFNWAENCPEIAEIAGFDVIVGNPPYVCSRNMDTDTLDLIKNLEVAKTGHPDLYIPFFQIGIENLNNTGILGYITVNTFMKSINGRALREYFEINNINLTIVNFGGEQIFSDRNTYTCICFLELGNGFINYIRTQSSEIEKLDLNNLQRFYYPDLNHKDGWNLVNDIDTRAFVNQIEITGIPFKDLYNTKNGIATLKNDVYKFTPDSSDDEYFYLREGEKLYPIEREICRDIINSNKLKTEEDILRIREKIIFPYDSEIKIIPERLMQKKYPKTYSYLIVKKSILAKRDKGTRSYEEWYAYGRRQSMDIRSYKLFFPHICEKPIFVISKERELLFYNGLAIVSDDLEKLEVIKKIMESDLFFRYIKNTTKDYASGYISMSRNYLKNFGVYQFTEEQKNYILNNDNLDFYLEELYGFNKIAPIFTED